MLAQPSQADSLRLVLDQATTVTDKYEALSALVRYYGDEDLSRARPYASQGLNLAIAEQRQPWLADFQYYFADVLQLQGQYDSAHQYFSQALHYYKKSDVSRAADVLLQMSFVFQNTGSHQQASEYCFEALELYEQLGDQKGVGRSYLELAATLTFLEKTEEALSYCYQAVDIYRDLEDQEGLSSAYELAAHTHLFMDEYDKALEMIDAAMAIQQKLGAPPITLASLTNTRGNVLKYLKRYEEALEAYESCLAVARDFQHTRGISATLANIGDVYLRQEKYALALPPKLEGVRMQEAYQFTSNLPENYDHLSLIYKGLGDFENALRYREMQAEISANSLALEKDEVVSELQLKYETEKKEVLIAQQELQLKQQRITQTLIAGIAGLLGVILFLLWRSIRLKQASNELLAATNTQLQQKNKENELLLQEIHHRVKNNLQVISSLLNLQSASIDDPNALQAVQESQNRVRSMALIHQKLYQGANLAAVEMKDYLETVGQTILETFGEAGQRISLEVPMEVMEVDVDTAIPLGLIVNELMINACKYAFPDERKGQIQLSLRWTEDDKRTLTIADNGVGYPAQGQESSGTGFGSRLVRLLVMQLNGKMNRNLLNGTHYEITF